MELTIVPITHIWNLGGFQVPKLFHFASTTVHNPTSSLGQDMGPALYQELASEASNSLSEEQGPILSSRLCPELV